MCAAVGLYAQLEHLKDRFAGREVEPSVAAAAFVRVRPDGQKFTDDEDATDEGGASALGAGAASGSA